MKVLTSAEIRSLEACAVEAGVSMAQLMENAGTACAEFILERMDVTGKTVVLLCGKGNNGGDGFVMARVLEKAGAKVTVVLMQGAPATELARGAYDRMHRGIDIILMKKAGPVMDCADVIVDAVFGFGFRGALPHTMHEIFQKANEAHALRIAVDLPSGAECDTGAVTGPCFKADHTVTFTALKPACVIYPAAGYCGKISVRQVGIKEEIRQMLPADTETVNLKDLKSLFKKRDPESHKGTFGRVLLVCGSIGMAGACIMAARGALRSGAGLVHIAVPHALYPILAPAVPEAVFTLYDADDSLEERICAALSLADSCVVGCGLGQTPLAKRLTDTVLRHARCPLVLDADALNLLAAQPHRLPAAKGPVIITPHPGEMARLCGKTVAEIRMDRIGTARAFAAKYRVITVLKGAGTVTASPAGQIFVNRTGNPGMARGGSGDVLAGMTGALLAGGMEPLKAAYAAACLHGAAGDRCAEKLSETAMLPTDLIEALPEVFRALEKLR